MTFERAGGVLASGEHDRGAAAVFGFRPQTVIDLGVATHTLELYEEFKDSRLLLIEPLLRSICGSYKAQYVLAAAGDTPGTAVNVHSEQLDCSSFQALTAAKRLEGIERS